jgi:hypothetical protein
MAGADRLERNRSAVNRPLAAVDALNPGEAA